MSGDTEDINSVRAVTAMVGLLVVAAVATVVMPILVGAMVDHLGLSARSAGLVAAANRAGCCRHPDSHGALLPVGLAP